MANKYMKIHSTSYVINDLQIKTRHHYTPIRISKPRTLTAATSAGKDVEPQELSAIAGGDTTRSQPTWKTVWQLLTKPNILLPYNSLIILLGLYPKELNTYIHTKTCTWMLPEALFIVAKTWKQPSCPSAVEYYLVLKQNEL